MEMTALLGNEAGSFISVLLLSFLSLFCFLVKENISKFIKTRN